MISPSCVCRPRSKEMLDSIDTTWFSFREIGNLVEIAIIEGPKDRTFRAAHLRMAE